MLDLVNGSFGILIDDHVIFLSGFCVVGYIDRFSYAEPSPHLRDEAHLIMVDDLFNAFLDLVF